MLHAVMMFQNAFISFTYKLSHFLSKYKHNNFKILPTKNKNKMKLLRRDENAKCKVQSVTIHLQQKCISHCNFLRHQDASVLTLRFCFLTQDLKTLRLKYNGNPLTHDWGTNKRAQGHNPSMNILCT